MLILTFIWTLVKGSKVVIVKKTQIQQFINKCRGTSIVIMHQTRDWIKLVAISSYPNKNIIQTINDIIHMQISILFLTSENAIMYSAIEVTTELVVKALDLKQECCYMKGSMK